MEYQTVWRGVPENLSASYPKGKEFTWWAISSCTSSLSVLESSAYTGTSGPRTMFSIETSSGKVIRGHSYFQHEDEIILPPGRYLRVIDKSSPAQDLHIIHLREITPPYPMLAEPFDLGVLKKELPPSKPLELSLSVFTEEHPIVPPVTLKQPSPMSSKKGRFSIFSLLYLLENVIYKNVLNCFVARVILSSLNIHNINQVFL